MHIHCIVMVVLYGVIIATNASKCMNLTISLTQKIDNEGFHRELNWLLERSPQSIDCKLVIKLNIGQEMYINPDQIADLNRLKQTSVLIEGEVDVEAPAHLGSQHIAYVFVPMLHEKTSLKVPFHLRYQRAQIGGGFGKVVVNKPSILALCPTANTVKAPCDFDNTTQCEWSVISYQALFDEVELLVPVGNLDDYCLVSIVTLLLGCAGCIYTLSVLSTTPL